MKALFCLAVLLNAPTLCFSQANVFAEKSLSEILSLEFEVDFDRKDINIYDKKPLLVNGILIDHFDSDFLFDVDTREFLHFGDENDRKLIRSKLKDSLVLYDLMNLVLVKDIYNGDVVYRRAKQRGYQIESKAPLLLKTDTITFKEKDNVLNCFSVSSKLVVWQRTFPEMIYAFSDYRGGIINLTTKTAFYQLSKKTGEILWSVNLATDGRSTANSEINVHEDKVYIWCEEEGLVVIDLMKQVIESRWLANREGAKFTMLMSFEADSIIARTPSNIYCLDRSDGAVYWVSDNLSIRSELSIHGKYIFFYQRGREGSPAAFSAFDRKTHRVEYATFTSDEYPAQDPDNGVYENRLDLTKISFLRSSYADSLLIGSDGTKIFGFVVK